VKFLWRRAIVGGRTAHRGADVDVCESEPVLHRDAFGLRRKVSLIKGTVQEVAGAIAGKDAAGAIGAMGTRSEPDEQEPRLGISKTWHWASPIFPIEVSTALDLGDLLAVSDQARAKRAFHDFPGQNSKLRYGFFLVNSSSMSDT
jgi:hypothetical protein